MGGKSMNGMKSCHFIGIGGIGMSGLAQLYRQLGYCVSGSDRDAGKPENSRIFQSLKAQGIRIYPQDGSYRYDVTPDFLIYSTAVEEGNPDFLAGEGIERIHRAAALAKAIRESRVPVTVAVSGSSGKTSVTAMAAEILNGFGIDGGCLDGGHVNAFANEMYCGNFHPGMDALVFEADESDKSLLEFSPDYAIVLNVGHDHYSCDELLNVFAAFLQRVKRGAVISADVAEALEGRLPEEIEICVFDPTRGGGIGREGQHFVREYSVNDGEAFAVYDNALTVRLPQVGYHTAVNLLAVAVLMEMMGLSYEKALALGAGCRGVARRFSFAGKTVNGAAVFDDYAHNPEKIGCCIRAAQELAGDHRVFAVWQPHGYKPFGFTREAMGEILKKNLRSQDHFLVLTPFYAGGTSSFKPSAEEVAGQWKNEYGVENVAAYTRESADRELRCRPEVGDIILIMGARDNSLSDWAKDLLVGDEFQI